MTMTAFYGLNGGIVGSPFDGIKVYPNGRHPYGQDVIGAHAIDKEHIGKIINGLDVSFSSN